MSHQRYTWNAFETILDGQVNTSADTILLQSTQNLRAPGYLVIEPDVSSKREYISFTGIATNSLTGVVRGLSGGQNGVVHETGSTVRAVVLHQFFDDLFLDIETLESANASHIGRATGHPSASRTAQGFMSGADKTKLDGIEASAKGDLTSAEILAKLLSVDGPGSGLNADKLDGIQAAGFTVISHTGATGSAHGNASTSSAGFMSGADKTKLDGIPVGGGGGGGTQSASDIRNLGFFDTSNDGERSGLDADKLDGQHASSFSPSGHTHGSSGTTQTASDIKGLGFFTTSNDGSGSGLDADKLDGLHASSFSSTGHAHDSRYFTETEVTAAIKAHANKMILHRRIFIQSSSPSSPVTNDLWIDLS